MLTLAVLHTPNPEEASVVDMFCTANAPSQPGPAPAAGPGLAYLTNVYPKPSHTFIRSEIAALERNGIPVRRLTVRSCAEALIDPEDVAEAARTTVLLDRGGRLVLAALLTTALRSPRRFAAALGMALQTTKRGGLGTIRAFAYLGEACLLARISRADGIGHVHVHFGTNPAAVAMLSARLGGPSYSMTVHGPDELDEPRQLCLAEKMAAARFTVAISSFGRAQLIRWASPEDWERIKVIPCAVAPGFLAQTPKAARRPPRTIVFVGRLSAQKGIPLLLDAAAELMRESPFELRIIGGGELCDWVDARLDELGIRDNVKLLGWRSSSGVKREIEAARALVLPSFAEGLPVVLMEALALGRPVIATAVAGTPELVDQLCGWLIPAGSTEALVEAMRACLAAEPECLAAMARTGRERVEMRHDPDRNAAALGYLLREELARC